MRERGHVPRMSQGRFCAKMMYEPRRQFESLPTGEMALPRVNQCLHAYKRLSNAFWIAVRFFHLFSFACQTQMGNASTAEEFPPQNDKTRICVEGFKISLHTGRAQKLAAAIQAAYPDEYDTWFQWNWKHHYAFHTHLNEEWFIFQEDHPLYGHSSSPIVWLEHNHAVEGSTEIRPGVHGVAIGGRDHLSAWAHKSFSSDKPENAPILALVGEPSMSESWVDETPGSCQRQ